ncbi:MAG: SIMPL domain-containing protein [Thermoleophilia bacterium]
MTHRRPPARAIRRAALAGLLAVPLAAAPAMAETVAATGVGQADITVSRPLNQPRIARAVEHARDVAAPRALANARAQAARYAEAAGLQLGPILSVEEPAPSPYGFYGAYGLTGNVGRFGPNRYCGQVTTVKRRVVDGKRRVVGRRTRYTCYAPQAAVTTLYVEFSATPLPTPAPAPAAP